MRTIRRSGSNSASSCLVWLSVGCFLDSACASGHTHKGHVEGAMILGIANQTKQFNQVVQLEIRGEYYVTGWCGAWNRVVVNGSSDREFDNLTR